MTSERLEAFSDGVLAIIITIMVLELEAPKDYTVQALLEILPTFLSYFVSFIYVSVYWVGHHHLFKLTKKINNQVLWANLHLLFWLSLIPFTTDWIGEGGSHNDIVPVLLYGSILFMSKVSYLTLRGSIAKYHGRDSEIGVIVRRNNKDIAILALYVLGLSLAFLSTYAAITCFFIVGILKAIYLTHFARKV